MTLEHTIFTVTSFVRTVRLRRALEAVDPNPHLNFWRVIYGNCMDLGVIDWCKLFGNDDAQKQPTHWKNQIPAADHDVFRTGLRTALSFTQPQWEAYRQTLVDYRNRGAAHLEVGANAPKAYPTFGPGLEAAYFYYDQILALPANAPTKARYPADLRDYSRRFEAQSKKIAQIAIDATTRVTEQVH